MRAICVTVVLILASLLATPVISGCLDCLKPKNPFKLLNSVTFEEGDTLQDTDGQLMVALSDRVLASVAKRGSREIKTSVNVIALPNARLQNTMLIRKLEIPRNYFDKDRSVALIKVLIGKELPYEHCKCNHEHYMFYVISGIPHKKQLNNSYCPLARDISKLLLPLFLKDDFFLTDYHGNRIVVRDMPPVQVDYVPNFDSERRKILDAQPPQMGSNVASSSNTKSP